MCCKESMSKKRRRPKAARKSRAKAKKPKFLSLRLQFPADGKETGGGISTAVAASSAAAAVSTTTTFSTSATDSHQLNLFPLHPEIQLQDRENHDQDNVEYFFSVADGGATTLTGLLDDSTTTGSMSSHGTSNDTSRQEDLMSPSSASLTYAGYGGHECKDGAALLVRNAMRNRERDSSEEKWVCYSEVVERKVKEEEVTSSAVDLRRIPEDRGRIQRLSLKLDYQEILNAWCNKGSLYVDAENYSQIVPDMMNPDFFSNDSSSCYNGMGWGLWTVPEMVGDIDDNGEMKIKNGGDEEELMKLGQREASVLRYKKKRQNRLFSKKIRYQVRKLNAEKRPRLKGRFVKRS